MEPLLGRSDTVLPEDEVSVAAVMFNWKKRTVTPAGGVSVTESPTGDCDRFELVVVAGVFDDWLPQLDMKTSIAPMKSSSATRRIYNLLGGVSKICANQALAVRCRLFCGPRIRTTIWHCRSLNPQSSFRSLLASNSLKKRGLLTRQETSAGTLLHGAGFILHGIG
jgi:hypothetical protein